MFLCVSRKNGPAGPGGSVMLSQMGAERRPAGFCVCLNSHSTISRLK